MRSQQHAWLGCVLLLVAGLKPVQAQPAAEAIPPATEDALHAMTQMAAVTFAGQVTAIRLPQRAGGTVEVEFAVEDGVRGVSSSSYTLREWAGLWAAGNEPFHVGQRYLMLLHAPGRAGLSSPVGGADGAIPILGSAGPASGLAVAEGRVVDLRWVATRVSQAISYAEKPVAPPTLQTFAVRADAREAQADVTLASPSASATGNGASYSAVMGVLRGWERDAAR